MKCVIVEVTCVATRSVIKSLNVIIITHRGEIATLSVIKLNFLLHIGAQSQP